MDKFTKIACCCLLLCYSAVTWSAEESQVCTDIGGVMYGEKTDCKKGDIIMVNPMMAAFLCDMSLPTITEDKTVICHFLGKKRPERKPKK